MPTISRFYGILVMMRYKSKEHNPPHIHASYGNYEAAFDISSGELIKGTFPTKGVKMIREFLNVHREELLKMWETGNYYQIPGLE